MHRLIDPILSQWNRIKAARSLRNLPDGEYSVAPTVPYVSQFASPDLVYSYIHERLQGRDDPNWQNYGAENPDEYTFWAHRACAIACVKMAVDTFHADKSGTMWEMIQQGRTHGGYRTHDENGVFVDEGWFYPALVKLADQYGLAVRGMAYASILDVCAAIRDGWLVAVAVTPDLGERGPLRRYDGHFVLAYGFTWQNGRCTAIQLHNPSGRYPELREGVIIPTSRFGAAFAHRFIAFKAYEV
jgi:hypothetical protein